MSVKEWHEAGEAFAERFPEVPKDAERILEAEVEFTEFLMSVDGEVGQALLAAGNRSIDFGTLVVRPSEYNGDLVLRKYQLTGYGLCWSTYNDHFSSCFDASPLDTVRAFYRHDQTRGGIVDYVKAQLDIISEQMLKEAAQK